MNKKLGNRFLRPRPEASGRDLVAICFAGHLVGQCRYAARMERSGTPGEAGHCEIKAAPKEMNRADLPDIAGAKSMEYAVDGDERLEKARYGFGVVGPRSTIISKRNGIRNFIRAAIELRCAAELPDEVQEARMKLSKGHRAEWEARSASIGRCADNCMVEKIEGDLHAHRAVRDY
jgi:hypothetical protein